MQLSQLFRHQPPGPPSAAQPQVRCLANYKPSAGQPEVRCLANYDVDWPCLIRAASAESLLPALWHRVQTLGLAPTLAPEIAHLLQTAESLNGERNRHILAEATHIAALLNTIGIEPVALKGLAYLLTGVYPHPAGRYLQDIDLLIPESQLPSAVSLLRRHGFLTDDSDPLVAFRQHSPGLQRPSRPPVELHHSLGIGICSRLLPAAELLRDATSLTVDGARFRIPSPTHLANHLILHSQLSHPYRDRIFPPLRALYDLQILTENLPIDWPALVERYRRHGQYLTLALHFKEAERVLGLRPPFAIELGLFRKMRWFHRRLLARFPRIRFVNPAYLIPFFLSRRLRMLREIARHPEHWLCFVKALLSPQSYRNLLRL